MTQEPDSLKLKMETRRKRRLRAINQFGGGFDCYYKLNLRTAPIDRSALLRFSASIIAPAATLSVGRISSSYQGILVTDGRAAK